MNRLRLFKTAGAMAALVSMMQPLAAMAAAPAGLKIAPISKSVGSKAARPAGNVAFLTHSQKLALLQKKVKYVFVLFQENRSFDHYFGTYPGALGLFSYGANPTNAQVPGFTQKIGPSARSPRS
jgi:phospholipase C